MTVPIQVPIITTSPPAALPVKTAVKPEKSESFEQILKQKTCESVQEGNALAQPDQVVKDHPNNNIQMEEKPVKEETKSEEQKEAGPAISEVKDQRSTETPSLSIPVEVLTQAVPVAVVVVEPVVVDAFTAQPSETTVDSGMDVMEASPVSISGTTTADSSVPAATSPHLKADTKGAQEVGSLSGKKIAAKPDSIQAPQPDGDQRSFSSASAIDPKIQQAASKGQADTEVRSSAGEAVPQPEKIAKTFKQALGQTITNVPVKSSTPGQTIQVKATDTKAPVVDEQPTIDLEKPSSRMDTKTMDAGNLNKSASTNVKVDAEQNPQVKTAKEAGTPEGTKSVQSQPVAQIPVDSQEISIKPEGTPERKVENQPPEAAEPAAPTISPGVVHERMRMDPISGKINEPARLAEAQTTEILRQISRQVAGSSGTGSQSIRIQLHPDDLGQIDLRITTGSLGTHVTLIADQSSTGKLLETHIDQLKQTLADAGIQMANVHVGQQSDQRSFRDPQYGQNTARQHSGYTSTNSTVSEELPLGQSRSKSSLVDYRI